jgi:16S rRNA U516 pseudouridylate synthase RsuA-like enzyme
MIHFQKIALKAFSREISWNDRFYRGFSTALETITNKSDEIAVTLGQHDSNRDIKIRLNRCLRPLTRKLADSAIFEGRVLVNGEIASIGMKISRNDKVNVNGLDIDVTVPAYNQVLSPFDLEECRLLGQNLSPDKHVYIKLWKPAGYKTTLKKNMPYNLIELLKRDLSMETIRRLYCVGGMASSMSGVILLTSDQRLVDLIKAHQHPVESLFDVKLLDGYTAPSTDEVLLQDQSKQSDTDDREFEGTSDVLAVSNSNDRFVYLSRLAHNINYGVNKLSTVTIGMS